MQTGAITGYIDVAQLALYGFWLFFAGLIWYLHREDKREGYPLVAPRRKGRVIVEGFPNVPPPKTFLMHDGSTILVPRPEAPEGPLKAIYADSFPGAPLVPVGDPMLAEVGPGAYARRADVPDLAFDDNLPKIVPLRSAPEFFLAWEDPDLHGFTVVGADGVEAGIVIDTWIDRSEVVVRYVGVRLTLPGATHTVLLPLNYLAIRAKQRQVRTSFIQGAQFAYVPVLRNPDVVTLLEEDKIMAYYSAGVLYATPRRAGPLL